MRWERWIESMNSNEIFNLMHTFTELGNFPYLIDRCQIVNVVVCCSVICRPGVNNKKYLICWLTKILMRRAQQWLIKTYDLQTKKNLLWADLATVSRNRKCPISLTMKLNILLLKIVFVHAKLINHYHTYCTTIYMNKICCVRQSRKYATWTIENKSQAVR